MPCRPLVVCLLLVAASCSAEYRSEQRLPEPPPGSGNVEIDMAGTWRIVSVTPEFDSGPTQNPLTDGLTPPRVGAEFSIDARGFSRAAGAQLRPQDRPDFALIEVLEYVNQVDRRFARYFLGVRDRRFGLGGLVQMAFGAVEQNRMVGFISYDYATPERRYGRASVVVERRLESFSEVPEGGHTVLDDR